METNSYIDLMGTLFKHTFLVCIPFHPVPHDSRPGTDVTLGSGCLRLGAVLNLGFGRPSGHNLLGAQSTEVQLELTKSPV